MECPRCATLLAALVLLALAPAPLAQAQFDAPVSRKLLVSDPHVAGLCTSSGCQPDVFMHADVYWTGGVAEGTVETLTPMAALVSFQAPKGALVEHVDFYRCGGGDGPACNVPGLTVITTDVDDVPRASMQTLTDEVVGKLFGGAIADHFAGVALNVVNPGSQTVQFRKGAVRFTPQCVPPPGVAAVTPEPEPIHAVSPAVVSGYFNAPRFDWQSAVDSSIGAAGLLSALGQKLFGGASFLPAITLLSSSGLQPLEHWLQEVNRDQGVRLSAALADDIIQIQAHSSADALFLIPKPQATATCKYIHFRKVEVDTEAVAPGAGRIVVRAGSGGPE